MIRTTPIFRLRTAALIAAIVSLALPATGLAQTMTLAKARAVAGQKAKVIKQQTGALSSTVTSCTRQTALKVTCKVRSRYSSGLSTCVTDVIVYYKTRSATTPRTAIGRTACS